MPRGLRRFLEAEVLPWFEMRKKELSNRPLIREQAFGESLDPDKLERLARYEVHLDRKLERTLVPSENLIRWIRRRKENRIMIETDGDLLQTSARIYAGLLSFA